MDLRVATSQAEPAMRPSMPLAVHAYAAFGRGEVT